MTKEFSSVKKLEHEIESWQTKFLTLQAGLGAAKQAKAEAEAARSEIVLLAKSGDRKAANELEKLTTAWLRAIAETNDFETAIKQCEEKIINLQKARLQAELQEKRDTLKQKVLEFVKTADGFDRGLAGFIVPTGELTRQSYEITNLAAELGVHQHVVLKMRQLAANVLLDRLAVFNWPEFGRPQPVFRNKSLGQLARQLFRQVLEPDGGKQRKVKESRELPEPPREKKPEAEDPPDEDVLEIPEFSLLEEEATT